MEAEAGGAIQKGVNLIRNAWSRKLLGKRNDSGPAAFQKIKGPEEECVELLSSPRRIRHNKIKSLQIGGRHLRNHIVMHAIAELADHRRYCSEDSGIDVEYRKCLSQDAGEHCRGRRTAEESYPVIRLRKGFSGGNHISRMCVV